MGRNFLKGLHGNLVSIIFSTYRYNLKKIYNKFKKAYKKLLSYFFATLFVLLFPFIQTIRAKIKFNLVFK